MIPEIAWDFAHIQIDNAGYAWAAIALDCDDSKHMSDGLAALPDPNWITVTKRGAHVFWCLRVPVAHHAKARNAPQRRLARIADYYAQATGADPSFNGLSRNPTQDELHGGKTYMLAPHGYTLSELASVIPFGWRKPRIPLTGIGRNCAMFEALMQWAGQEKNKEIAVYVAAMSINDAIGQSFGTGPLPLSEVAGISRSVERYRTGWIASGWHTQAFRNTQRVRGQKGGLKSRRGKDPNSERSIQPWVELGISMPTYYRHKKAAKEQGNQIALFDPEPQIKCARSDSR